MAYTTYWNTKLQRYVRRKKPGRRSGIAGAGLQGLGAFGTGKSLKSMLGGVKGVIITGAIAAGGAVTTDALFEKIGEKWEIAGWQRDAAKMALGIALGIVIAKFLRKPKLAAAFAIGPIVVGAMRIFADVVGRTEGLGLTVVEDADRYTSMYAPFYGAQPTPQLPVGATTYVQRADAITSPPAYVEQQNAAAQSIYA